MGAAASTCPVSPAITIIILIVVALVVGLLLVLVWKRCCRHPAAGEGGGTRGAAPKWGGSGWEGGHPSGLTALFFLPGDSRDLGRKSGQVVVSRAGGSARSLLRLQPPREGWGSVQGAVAEQSGGLPRLPPPRGLVSPPRLGVSSLAALCFSPPQHYLVLQLTRMLAGRAGDADNIRNEHLSQDQERGLLPAVGAPDAPGLEVGHRAPPLGRALSLFLYLHHAHQLQGFQGRKVSIRGVRLILIPGPQNLLF